MFPRKHQRLTYDEFGRYFAGRILNEQVAFAVYEGVRTAAKVQHLSPLETLSGAHRISGSDLDELVVVILKELGISLPNADDLCKRPNVETIEGLVLFVDFAYRLHAGGSDSEQSFTLSP